MDPNERMYQNLFPEENELVMVRVMEVSDTCVYVDLLEYNKRGIIVLSEISRKRIRTVNKVMRVGKIEISSVVRVDPVLGYIDLSKKRVDPEDVPEMESKWSKSKAVHTIMRYISEKSNHAMMDLCARIAWPLYETHTHAFDALMELSKDPLIDFDLDISEEERDYLMTAVHHYMTPPWTNVITQIEITCFSRNGVEHVKHALRVGQQSFQGDPEHLSIRLDTPPVWNIVLKTKQVDEGKRILEDICHRIETSIQENEGTLCVKNQTIQEV